MSRTALPNASQLKLEERNWPVEGLNVRAGPSIVVNRTAAGRPWSDLRGGVGEECEHVRPDKAYPSNFTKSKSFCTARAMASRSARPKSRPRARSA